MQDTGLHSILPNLSDGREAGISYFAIYTLKQVFRSFCLFCEVNGDYRDNDACILTLFANPCLKDNPCHITAVCKQK